MTHGREIRKILLFFVAAWILTGCDVAGVGEMFFQTGGRSVPDLQIEYPPTNTMAAGLNTRHMTPSPEPVDSPTPLIQNNLVASSTPYPTDTIFVNKLQPSKPATPDQTVASPVCSPLERVALNDLHFIISEGYHPPPMGKDDRHQGVDFSYYHWNGDFAIEGTHIQSVLGGNVAAAIKDSFPFGRMVIIETPKELLSKEMISVFGIGEEESLYILYAHMSIASPLVVLGSRVQPCQTLGYVGRTGNTDAPHLHLETRVGPMNWRFEVFSSFRDTDTLEEKQNYRLWRISGLFVHFDPMRLLTWEVSRGATATPTALPHRRE